MNASATTPRTTEACSSLSSARSVGDFSTRDAHVKRVFTFSNNFFQKVLRAIHLDQRALK
jgi:hypothetical protein